MGVFTGDLLPRSSGSASLGAEQTNGMGGFTGDIRPYAHVHQVSGVLHHAGSSGILRFGFDELGNPIIECSTDGGTTFGDLPHSGQIQEAINASAGAGGTPHTLQAAYNGGDTIRVDQAAPVVVHEPHGGLPVLSDFIQINAFGAGLIMASGHTDTPENVDSFAATEVYPGLIYLKSSGISSETGDDKRSHSIGLGYLRNGALPDSFTIGTSGKVFWNIGDDMTMFNSGGNILFNNIAVNQTVRMVSRDDTVLEAFGNGIVGSGRLAYRFGPYESWHQRQSFTGATMGPNGDGYFPIPHSGQILQMILENGGGGGAADLQEAYEADNNIFTSAGQGGPVNIVGIGRPPLALALAEPAGYAHIRISGLMAIPSTVTRGDLWIQNHTAGYAAQLNGGVSPSTLAESDARSIGPALPFYDTGSGVTNIMIASGMATYANASSVAFDQDNDAILDNTADITPVLSDDKFYSRVNNSGIVTNVAGSYRITFAGGVSKTDGNHRQDVLVSARIRDNRGNEFTLFGAENSVTVRNSDGSSEGSVAGSVLADLEIGEAVYLRYSVGTVPLPDFDKVSVLANTAVIDLQYIGPKHFGKFNRVSRGA